MNRHNLKYEITSLLLRTVDRFNTIRTQLKHIKNIEDKNNVSGCVDLVEDFIKEDKNNVSGCLDLVDDFIEIDIESEKEDFNRLLESLEETEIPEKNLAYKYFLITIRDNDFYMSLSTLGDIFVRTLGYEFTSDRFDFEKFKTSLPDLVCSIFSICQNEHSDYVRKHLKICYTPEEINDFIQKYGMCACEDYENSLFKNDPVFADVVHCDCDAEALIIKLAYNNENNEYIEEKSDWLVI